MTKPVTLPRLAAGVALTVAALAVVAPHVIEGDAFLGVDHDAALLWLSACFAGLGLVAALLTLVVGRVIDSARRQCRRTAHVLQPLLLLPAVATPVDVADLLRELHLEGRTRLIDLDTPVALCHGLLRPRLLLSTGALRGLPDADGGETLALDQPDLADRIRREGAAHDAHLGEAVIGAGPSEPLTQHALATCRRAGAQAHAVERGLCGGASRI